MLRNLAVEGEGDAMGVACGVRRLQLADLNARPVVQAVNKVRGGLKRRNGTGSQTPSSTARD